MTETRVTQMVGGMKGSAAAPQLQEEGAGARDAPSSG